MKRKKGWVLFTCAVLFVSVYLSPQIAFSQQAKYYAVQVAALRSEECAVELVKGLLGRGFDAYLVKAELPKLGIYYRVRVGKFENLEIARGIAESMLDSGLLDTLGIAVTAYEAPLSGSLNASTAGQNGSQNRQTKIPLTPLTAACPVEVPEKKSNKVDRPADIIAIKTEKPASKPVDLVAARGSKAQEVIVPKVVKPAESLAPKVNKTDEFIATLGKSRWMLSASQSVLYVPMKGEAAASPDEVVLLMRAVDQNKWRLRTDVSQLAPPAANKQMVDAASKAINSVLASSLTPTALAKTTAEANKTDETKPALSLPPLAAAPPAIPVDNRSIADNRGPIINRVGGSPIGDLSALAPIKLQGMVEMRNGQLTMKIKNLDQVRAFSGTARVTLSDDKNTNDISPVQVVLQPNQELILPVNETSMPYGDWMLMVYNEREAIQLIRSAPFGDKPAPPPSAKPSNEPDPSDDPAGWTLTVPQFGTPQFPRVSSNNGSPNASSPNASPTNASPNGLPNVTGMYDTTNVILPPEPNSAGTGASNPPGNVGNLAETLENDPPANLPPPSSVGAPANLGNNSGNTVTPDQLIINSRMIGANNNNVTMELNISAPRVPGYVKVKLQAGDYQDEKNALMNTLNGRIPFVVPADKAKGNYRFEIIDVSGRVMGTGSGSFQQPGSGK